MHTLWSLQLLTLSAHGVYDLVTDSWLLDIHTHAHMVTEKEYPHSRKYLEMQFPEETGQTADQMQSVARPEYYQQSVYMLVSLVYHLIPLSIIYSTYQHLHMNPFK